MPESAAEVHARVVARSGEGGRLPVPALVSAPDFPWESVDGQVVPAVVADPYAAPAGGEEGRCGTCARLDPARVVWEDERWVLTHAGRPSGLPLVLTLQTREHVDFNQVDDELASQFGRISVRLVRIVEHLPHVARVRVDRLGDGDSHLQVWFLARTEGLGSVTGAHAAEWDATLPPGPEDVWREDLATVADKLANWGGEARARHA